MSMRIALIAAIVLGLAAAFAMKTWMTKKEVAFEKKNKLVDVLVARENIAQGKPLTERMWAAKATPIELLVHGVIAWSERNYYLNKIATSPMQKGDPILKQFLKIRRERDGDPVIVRKGYRAVTIAANQMITQGFLVQPGMYVDIAGTFQMTIKPSGATSSIRRASRGTVVSQTILLWEAVPVIAIDNKTRARTTRSHGISRYSSITFEMRPADALRLLDATSKGQIHLLLRSGDDVAKPLEEQVKERKVFSATSAN